MWYIMVKAKIMSSFNGDMTAVTKKHAHGKIYTSQFRRLTFESHWKYPTTISDKKYKYCK